MPHSSASQHDIAPVAAAQPAPAIRPIDNRVTIAMMHGLGFADRWKRFGRSAQRDLCLFTIEVDARQQHNAYWLLAAQAAYVSGSDAHIEDLIAVEAAGRAIAAAGDVELLVRPVRSVQSLFNPRTISDTQVDDACDLLAASMKAARNSNHNGEREVIAAVAGIRLRGLMRAFTDASAAEMMAHGADDQGAVVRAEDRADRAHKALVDCLAALGLDKAQIEQVVR